jgi:hypothetical protein
LIVCILSTPVFSVWVLGQISVQFFNWYVPVLGGYLFFLKKNHHHFRVFGKKRRKEPVSSGYFKNQNPRIGCIWVFEKHQNQTNSRFWVFEKPSTIEELCNPGCFKTLQKTAGFHERIAS